MGDCNNIDIMTQQLQLLSEKETKSIKYVFFSILIFYVL